MSSFVWYRPLLFSLIRKVFDYEVDYDELVNELYLYLMADDGRRFKTFQGVAASISGSNVWPRDSSWKSVKVG